jgi:cytoskeleton protein RodZ
VWGVARVFDDTPQELVSPAPDVVDSAGLATADSGGDPGNDPAKAPKLTLATLEVSAVAAGPQVVVRDRDGRILWAGKLAEGQQQQTIGLAPFDVTASNGAAVKVSFLGRPKGAVGDSPAAGSRQFG